MFGFQPIAFNGVTAAATVGTFTPTTTSIAHTTGIPWFGMIYNSADSMLYPAPFFTTTSAPGIQLNPASDVVGPDISSGNLGGGIGNVAHCRGIFLKDDNQTIYFNGGRMRRATFSDIYVNASIPTVFGTTFAAGTDRWWGQARNGSSVAMCAPYNDTVALKIDTSTNTTTTFGTFAGGGAYAGVCWSTSKGFFYFIPHSSGTVAKVNPTTNAVTTFGTISGSQQYAGGVLNSAGDVIYAIPYDATQVLKIDLTAETVSLVTGSLGATSGKWSGGVLAADGCIYGIPYNSTSILKIDPSNDSLYLGSTATITGATAPRWQGGCLAPNGKIYCSPATSSNSFLVINPGVASSTAFCINPQRNHY